MLRSAIAACNVCGRPLLRQSPVPCRTALVSQPASGGRSVRTQARRNMAKELLELQKERTEAPAKQPAVPTVNAKIGVFGEPVKRLAAEMFRVMYEDDGVGLAAPQVGVNVRMMVFNPTGVQGEGKEMILVNPEIVSSSNATESDDEGCLSFPEIYGSIERAVNIKVKAQDEEGRPLTLTLNDFVARIFQHEYDHLQGTLFHDRMVPQVLEEAREQLVAMEEAYLRAHPGAAIRRVGS